MKIFVVVLDLGVCVRLNVCKCIQRLKIKLLLNIDLHTVILEPDLKNL